MHISLVDIGQKWPRLEGDYIRSFIAYCYYPLEEASHSYTTQEGPPMGTYQENKIELLI